ncbi:hypothetical protein H0H87_000616, partial [Tephrocybe sp. NHM501043]
MAQVRLAQYLSFVYPRPPTPAQHVGSRRYSQFLSQVYDVLDEAGFLVFQVAGIRPAWQFEDLVWDLFMIRGQGGAHNLFHCYSQFLSQLYGLLDNNGWLFFYVAGIRPAWQFEDLIWGLRMNKDNFPGGNASCSLGWVIGK